MAVAHTPVQTSALAERPSPTRYSPKYGLSVTHMRNEYTHAVALVTLDDVAVAQEWTASEEWQRR